MIGKNGFIYLLLCVFVGLSVGTLAAFAASPSVFGTWQTPDQDGVVAFYPCDGGAVCGRFVWLKDDSDQTPSLDDKNPDPALRGRRLLGLTFMGGFKEGAEPGSYEGGWIYSPRHGSRFSASLRLLSPDELELHGYMFLPILGESQVWHRTGKPSKK